MKKALMVVSVLMVLFSCVSACAEIYPLTARVYAVDHDADTVVVETCTGILFAFDGAEDWMVGDCASLLMDDNGTTSVLDDCILSARYASWDLSK